MKKRILSMMIVACMMVGFSSCGAKGNDFAKITIEGNNYDLSQNFEEVISAMAEDGLQVRSYLKANTSINPYIYNTECKLEEAGEVDLDTQFYAEYAPVSNYYWAEMDDNGLVIKLYEIDGGIEYMTNIGIGYESREENLKELKGYEKMDLFLKNKSATYGALYVDGKMVDLQEYLDEFEEWKNTLNENGFMKAMEKHLPHLRFYKHSSRIWADYFRMSHNYDELKAICEEQHIPLDTVMLTNIAMHEAGKKLEAGEIKSYTLIRYEASGDGEMRMKYMEYSIDKGRNLEE